jgi:Porin subfamily
MKMVKSLLLGSAAGLVAVTTGQAADLPVKAKPVEYVKVCSLYGAGFYYMPGTDLCLKIGGWVRGEAVTGVSPNGSPTWGPYANNAQQRSTSNTVFRARGYITADAREQTAYGTARGYIAVGLSTSDVGLNTAGNQFSANRAFVQFAGFTGGISQSFYDYYSTAASGYLGGYTPNSDTGDPGWLVFGYTAQFGNGLSATVSMETRRMTQIIDANGNGGGSTTGFIGACSTYADSLSVGTSTVAGGGSLFPTAGAYGGQQMGDIVANIRLDQAWGGAQVMGALHQLNATYYSSATSVGAVPGSGALPSNPSVTSGANPSNAWGWAVGAGLRLNFPMIGEGDYFQAQANVSEGALRYLFQTPNSNWDITAGHNQAFGVLSDAVYGGCAQAGNVGAPGCLASGATSGGGLTSLQLTSAWGFNASYEHHWSPAWQTSVYGGYTQVMYNSQANNMLCTSGGFGANGPNSSSGTLAVAAAGCNMDWSTWYVGSRTQWNVTKTFYMGVDVLYEQLQSASVAAVPTCTAAATSGTCGIGGFGANGALGLTNNVGEWAIRFRAHKDFLP